MTSDLAWDLVFDAVSARFAARSPAIVCEFGWKAPDALEEAPRIVFVPGDDTTNDVGDIGPPRNAGEEPRDVAQLGELFTIYVAARDDADREDERKQYVATRLLFDELVLAVHLAAAATHRFVSIRWVNPGTTLRTGGCIRAVVSLEATVPDGESGTALTGVVGVQTTELLDAEEEDATGTVLQARVAADTNVVLSGLQTLDDVALGAGDRALLVNQTNPVENGTWLAAVGAWIRSGDELVHGTHVHVTEGTALANAGFRVATPDPFVVGTDPFAFQRLWPLVP